MLRVAFAGAQDTGKTTLAKELSSIYRRKNYLTEYVEECARTYQSKWKEPMASLSDQLFILDKQMEREQSIAPKADIVFFDSPIFLSYIYTNLNYQLTSTVKNRDILLHVYEKSLQVKYDLVFYLSPFRQPTPDGVRPESLIKLNSDIDKMIIGFLDLHRINYVSIVVKDVGERITLVSHELDRKLAEGV